MNDLDPQIIETEETVPKNKFPILIQLGVLSLILFGIYGTFILQSLDNRLPETASTEVINVDTTEYPITPQKIDEVALRAEAAYVWDVRGQRVLYSKNADEVLPLASITKLMTALLAYELISEDKEVSVPLAAVLQDGSSGLATGEYLSIEKLSELALVSSSNDAAYTLASSIGALLGEDDPTTQFVKGMNIRAEELGLITLDFKNTTGLDISPSTPGAVGSARDISFLMEYIVNNYPELISPTQQVSTRVYNSAGAYHEADNTNELVRAIPNLIGSKTGYTDLAGGNLTVAFDAGLNRPIIITVLGSTRDSRFTDVMTLVEAVQKSLAQ